VVWRAVGGALAALVLIAPVAGAQGLTQTAFAWSPATSNVGWCFGCDAATAMEQARAGCARNGATDCRAALACLPGHAAYARSLQPGTAGMGLVCGMASEPVARALAIVSCMAATRRYCGVRQVDSPQAGSVAVTTGDVTFLIQEVLARLGNYGLLADGIPTPGTLASLQSFEAAMGMPLSRGMAAVEDGSVAWRLIMAYGGRVALIEALEAEVLEEARMHSGHLIRAEVVAPLADESLWAELAAASATARNEAAALWLRLRGHDCAYPALTAGPMIPGDVEGPWRIDCQGALFDLLPGGAVMTTPK
jgi:hypothetical protein